MAKVISETPWIPEAKARFVVYKHNDKHLLVEDNACRKTVIILCDDAQEQQKMYDWTQQEWTSNIKTL